MVDVYYEDGSEEDFLENINDRAMPWNQASLLGFIAEAMRGYDPEHFRSAADFLDAVADQIVRLRSALSEKGFDPDLIAGHVNDRSGLPPSSLDDEAVVRLNTDNVYMNDSDMRAPRMQAFILRGRADAVEKEGDLFFPRFFRETADSIQRMRDFILDAGADPDVVARPAAKPDKAIKADRKSKTHRKSGNPGNPGKPPASP